MSIPLLQHFYSSHEKEGLVVLGINMDDEPEGVYPFVKQIGISYPVLYGGGSDVGSLYGVQGIPTFIFLDSTGRVVERFEGFSTEMVDAWEKTFAQIRTSTPS